jgi:hypothetical protein
MASDPIPIANKILAAISAGDAPLAQSHLDGGQATLPRPRRFILQARIHVLSGNPARAVTCLETAFGISPTPKAGINRAFAQAYLADEQPEMALQRTTAIFADCDGKPTPLDFQTHINVLAVLDDPEKLLKVVRAALAAHPQSHQLHRTAVLHFARSGAFEDALQLLGSMDVARIPTVEFQQTVEIFLRAGQSEALVRMEPVLRLFPDQVLSQALVQTLLSAQNDAQKAQLESTMVGLVDKITSAVVVYRLAGAGFKHGLNDLGDRALVRFDTLKHKLSDTGVGDTQMSDTGSQKWCRDRKDIIDWLNIPESRQKEWFSQVFVERQRQQSLRHWLARSKGNIEKFSHAFVRADLEPLQEIAAQNSPAILATTHCGFMLGTLMHLITRRVAISIQGGDPVLSRVVPGGERLVTIPLNETPSRSARRMIKVIRSNGIVGLASDGLRGVRLTPFEHKGFIFELPDSIPQMVFRYRVRLIWMNTRWQDGQQRCECIDGPQPLTTESFEDYRVRWFTFLLDRMHAICSLDFRNAQFNPRLLRGPAG